jgi:hypothetical protein
MEPPYNPYQPPASPPQSSRATHRTSVEREASEHSSREFVYAPLNEAGGRDGLRTLLRYFSVPIIAATVAGWIAGQPRGDTDSRSRAGRSGRASASLARSGPSDHRSAARSESTSRCRGRRGVGPSGDDVLSRDDPGRNVSTKTDRVPTLCASSRLRLPARTLAKSRSVGR